MRVVNGIELDDGVDEPGAYAWHDQYEADTTVKTLQELAEWLESEEMQRAKSADRARESLSTADGENASCLRAAIATQENAQKKMREFRDALDAVISSLNAEVCQPESAKKL